MKEFKSHLPEQAKRSKRARRNLKAGAIAETSGVLEGVSALSEKTYVPWNF